MSVTKFLIKMAIFVDAAHLQPDKYHAFSTSHANQARFTVFSEGLYYFRPNSANFARLLKGYFPLSWLELK